MNVALLNSLLEIVEAGAVLLVIAFLGALFLRQKPAGVIRGYWAAVVTCLALLWPLEALLPVWELDAPLLSIATATAVEAPANFATRMDSASRRTDDPVAGGGAGALVLDEATGSAVTMPETVPPDEGPMAARALSQARPAGGVPWLRRMAGLIPVIWSIGVVLLGIRLLAGRIALGRLWRKAEDAGEEWHCLRAQVETAIGLHRSPALRISRVVKVPMAWGIFRPRVLLPVGAGDLDFNSKRALLVHELSHVRAADAVPLTVGQIAVVLHWVNPLAWIALGRLRLAQERACDDAVVNEGCAAEDYADLLVKVAQAGACGRFLPASVAMTMAQPSTLKKRIAAILDEEMRRTIPSKKRTVLTMAGFLGISLALASLGRGEKEIVEDKGTRPAIGEPVGDESSFGFIRDEKKEEQKDSIFLTRGTGDEEVSDFRGGGVDASKPGKKEGIAGGISPFEDMGGVDLDGVDLAKGTHTITITVEDGRATVRAIKSPSADLYAAGKGERRVSKSKAIRRELVELVGQQTKDADKKLTVEIVDGQILRDGSENEVKNKGGASNFRPAVEVKLKAIVIPEVAFRNTPLEDVLLYLGDRAEALDQPHSEGLNFVLLREARALYGSNDEAEYEKQEARIVRTKELTKAVAEARAKYISIAEALHVDEVETRRAEAKLGLENLTSALKELEAAKAEWQAIADKAPEDTGAYYHSIKKQPDHPVTRACAAYIDARSKLEDTSRQYSSDHPQVAGLQRAVEAARKQLDTAVARNLKSLESRVMDLQDQVARREVERAELVAESDPAETEISLVAEEAKEQYEVLRAALAKQQVEEMQSVVDGRQADGITLVLKNMPLGDVLRYVCQLAGLEMAIEERAILFGTPQEIAALPAQKK